MFLVGLQAYSGFSGWMVTVLAAGSAVTAGLFHGIFGRVVLRQVTRIGAYEQERVGVHRFLDRKGYIMMLVMSTVGIALRAFNLVPAAFVAAFYTGLGFSLAFAGVAFLIHRLKGADWRPRPHRYHRLKTL